MASQQNPLDPRYEFYRESLIELIKNSHPNFTIGIYGEWGMGKSTFLKYLYNDLSNSSEITTVWFNPWQYEAETNYALLPLLKEMAIAVKSEDKNDNKNKLKTAIFEVLKALAKISPYILSAFLPVKWNKDDIELIREAAKGSTDQLIDTINKLNEKMADQFSYSEGIKRIENAMKIIREDSKTSNFRIVVFIDDLDRCSPKKALEVFESIKVLLDIEGFIFIIGIDRISLSAMIERQYYEENGLDYLDKIIQIPIYLPDWNDDQIKFLIDSKFLKESNIISKSLRDNISVITSISENNPADAKRLVDNLLFTLGVHRAFIEGKNQYDPLYNLITKDQDKGSEKKVKALTIMHILHTKWPEIYKIILLSKDADRNKFYKLVKSIAPERVVSSWYYRNISLFVPFSRYVGLFYWWRGRKKVTKLIKKYSSDGKFFDFLDKHADFLDDQVINLLKDVPENYPERIAQNIRPSLKSPPM